MIFLKWSSQTVNQDHQGFQRPWNMFETTDLRLHLRVPSPKLPCLAVDAADIALNPQSPVESCDSWEITWCKSGTQNKHRSLLQKIPEPKKKTRQISWCLSPSSLKGDPMHSAWVWIQELLEAAFDSSQVSLPDLVRSKPGANLNTIDPRNCWEDPDKVIQIHQKKKAERCWLFWQPLWF
jgi:hypothetical protein